MTMTSLSVTTPLGMAETEELVRAALATEGFGVLSEIDVAATLKAKIDVDRAPLKILGACNPSLAHRALTLDERASLFLPCNVVLSSVAEGTLVRAVDPREIMGAPEMSELALEAAERLARALASLPTEV